MANVDRSGDKISTEPGMTIKHWMLFGAIVTGVLATSLVAQNPPPTPVPADPPPPPLVPASEPATSAPAPTKKVEKKSDKKAPAAKKASTAKKATETERRPAGKLKPGQAVATEKNVNVRGQAALNSEIVTHLKRGDVVTVIEYVTTKAPADEPSEWAKILLPAGSAVWVNASYIDSGKVKPNRLNIRSGPGENYSILGRIDKGTAVRELERKGEWIKIEAPSNSYAFAWARLFSASSASSSCRRLPISPASCSTPCRRLVSSVSVSASDAAFCSMAAWAVCNSRVRASSLACAAR